MSPPSTKQPTFTGFTGVGELGQLLYNLGIPSVTLVLI